MNATAQQLIDIFAGCVCAVILGGGGYLQWKGWRSMQSTAPFQHRYGKGVLLAGGLGVLLIIGMQVATLLCALDPQCEIARDEQELRLQVGFTIAVIFLAKQIFAPLLASGAACWFVWGVAHHHTFELVPVMSWGAASVSEVGPEWAGHLFTIACFVYSSAMTYVAWSMESVSDVASQHA